MTRNLYGGGGSHHCRKGLGSIGGSNGRIEIAGEILLHSSDGGFIDGAQITIAAAAFGVPIVTDKVKLIALHEIDDVLRTGHANFRDIMAPALNYEKVSVSKCNVNALLSAEQWKLGG